MKKLLVFVLLVTMLLPTIGMAKFDFASMTDEQLLLFNKELTAELFSREKTAIVPVGRYVIGEDIPEGEYELTILKPDASYMCGYKIYENSEQQLKNDYAIRGIIVLIPTPDSRVFLKSGNILEIDEDVFMTKSHRIIEFK